MAYEPSLHDRFGPRFLNRQRTARPWQRQDCVRRHLPRHQSVVHAVCECVSVHPRPLRSFPSSTLRERCATRRVGWRTGAWAGEILFFRRLSPLTRVQLQLFGAVGFAGA